MRQRHLWNAKRQGYRAALRRFWGRTFREINPYDWKTHKAEHEAWNTGFVSMLREVGRDPAGVPCV